MYVLFAGERTELSVLNTVLDITEIVPSLSDIMQPVYSAADRFWLNITILTVYSFVNVVFAQRTTIHKS